MTWKSNGNFGSLRIPPLRFLRVHGPRREPRNLLTRLGGSIPRVSITVDYEDVDVTTE